MLLGIDIGTSSCKTTLFDTSRGVVVGGSRRPLRFLSPSPERAEIDAEELWQNVLAVLRELTSKCPEASIRVRAIGVSVFFPTLLPLGANGRPLRPALLYNDRRSQAEVDEFKACFGHEALSALTGNQLTPGTSVLPGILWLRRHEPEIVARTRCFAQLGAYITQRLTGQCRLEPTHSSLSALCAGGDEMQWSPAILSAAGLSAEQLPELAESLSIAGGLLGAVAADCGLPAGVPVICANGDAPLAALGAGLCRPGQVFVSVGSTDCLMYGGARPSGNPLFCNVRHVLPGQWLAIGTMSSAGAAVKWWCEDAMGGCVDDMCQCAAAAPAGSRGVVFMPYLQGERTPHWDAAAKGCFFGLDASCGRAEMTRAVLEGVACGWRQILGLLEKEYGFLPDTLLCAGGGSRNALWNRIKASVLRRPLTVLRYNEMSSLGACIAAGLGSGVFRDGDEAMAATAELRIGEVVEPVAEWSVALDQSYATYCDLYPALRHLWR
ncbi:MAG: FGGY family carbohydrate kinase [Lentisphaeria bacterium]|nr:FGGY family carbohydrate kinase [Lentisphaeria bacterium]